MAMDKSRYPANWKEISQAVRHRAGDKCEECGVPNKAYIVRKRGTPDYLIFSNHYGCFVRPNGTPFPASEAPADYDYDHPVRVILTVHHKGVDYPDGTPGNPHDKMDCRDENLAALCQRCHLRADLPLHIENRKKTMARKREQKLENDGQRRLF